MLAVVFLLRYRLILDLHNQTSVWYKENKIVNNSHRYMKKPDGYIYCTQTFQLERNVLLELIKPLLKYMTSIDFGKVTYEDEFRATMEAAGLEIEYSGPIPTTEQQYVKHVRAHHCGDF